MRAGVIVYPNDTVRKLLQLDGGSAGRERVYRGPLHCWGHTWRTGGLVRLACRRRLRPATATLL